MREDTVAKVAHSEGFQVFARVCMVFLTFVGLPLGGWMGLRAVSALDSTRDDINAIKIVMRGMQGQNDLLADRINSVEKNANDRINAVSGWNQRNAEAIDRIRDRMFK